MNLELVKFCYGRLCQRFILSHSILRRRTYLTAEPLKLALDFKDFEQCDESIVSNQNKVEATCNDYPSNRHISVLNENFGIQNFKPLQWTVISSILNERRDNCVIMPTGYGKSLCYQYPAIYTNGLSIVVSPLISLMQDQVQSLEKRNIPACFVGSAQTNKSEVTQKLLQGYYRVLYLTPEAALSDYGLYLLNKLNYLVKITLLAIDEAHCILKWGKDFRLAYGGLSNLRRVLPNTPIMALTATATDKERDGIITSLKLKYPQILCTRYDLSNLRFIAKKMTKEPFGDISNVLYEIRTKYNIEEGSVIIYCLTRKNTEKISSILVSMGISCQPYHAGLDNFKRKVIMDDFMNDKLKVIVATTAFGMGINKPDVRIVIHYGTSISLEGYYQESGRAGRDGKPALCVLFYSLSDFVVHRYLHSLRTEFRHGREEIPSGIAMKKYVSLVTCRKQFIKSYFDKTINLTISNQEHCCDNCDNNITMKSNNVPDRIYDYSSDAKIFMGAIKSFHPKTFGVNTIILLLTGSKSKKVESYRRHPLYGAGAGKSEEWWKNIAQLLEMENYIKLTSKLVGSALYTKVILDKKGEIWLKNNIKKIVLPIKVRMTKDVINLLK